MATSKSKTPKWLKNKRVRLWIACLLVALLLGAVGYFMEEPLAAFLPNGLGGAATPALSQTASPVPAGREAPTPTAGQQQDGIGTLDVYILDVGQGDSIFLRSPGGKTMLVDASISGMASRIDAFLEEQSVDKLDVVIATHPHADHIGGMRSIIMQYPIGTYYMPDAQTNTKTYETLLDALLEKDVRVKEAIAGMESLIEWDEDVEVRILSPVAGQHANLNDASIVCRVRYGDTAILLAGDAEEAAERRALSELPPSVFQAAILKLGHHGSNTSNSEAFLQAVAPEVAIASVGEDNTYGHPHPQTMERLENHGIVLYRTDLDGTVHISMDGAGYTIITER